MFIDLQKHPFAVQAYFDFSLVLTYALPIDKVKPLIPEIFQLSTYQNQWAFIAVALVKTKALRPSGLPKLLGKDFFLAGYRAFVEYRNKKGIKRRGLYILKSQTDNKIMQFFGNLFTHYKYSTIDIQYSNGKDFEVFSNSGNFKIIADPNSQSLPQNSVFESEKDAMRFVGPMPYTFTFDQFTNRVITVKGVRKNWSPKLVKVTKAENSFFEQKHLDNPILSSAFITSNINYKWKKGEIEYL